MESPTEHQIDHINAKIFKLMGKVLDLQVLAKRAEVTQLDQHLTKAYSNLNEAWLILGETHRNRKPTNEDSE